MKKILILLLLAISNVLNAQIGERLQGTYQIRPSSDSPYNQFSFLIVDENSISLQVDGVVLFRYEPMEVNEDSSMILKCILYRGQLPSNEMLKFRYTINFIELNDHIQVSIAHKNVNKNIDVKRL